MKKSVFAFLAASLCLAACQIEIVDPNVSDDVLSAQIEQKEVTKTVLGESNNVLWSENDQIVAFMKSSYGHKYQIKPSFAGKTYADFSRVSSASGDDLSAGMEWDHNVAYYPYSESIECVKSGDNYALEVVLPATHDTGSAVMAVPANDDDFVYLSSGTWSLMGIERKEADSSPRSKACNFTNEGGYEYRFRYLKNIMGLWMLQSVRRELNSEGEKKYGFPELIAMAKEGDDFPSMLDVNDASFLAPENMQKAIDAYCERTNQAVPQNLSERLACIYHSLAQSYADTIKEIEDIAGRTFKRLHIVGGGCQDMHLNEMTKKYTGKEVYAGPIEGTALGNLMAQMIKAGEFASLEEAREAVACSFDIKKI